MIKSFFSEDEETGIDWLDVAVAIANAIVDHIITEIESNGRLAESGKATVLKTADMPKAYVSSNLTSSAIE